MAISRQQSAGDDGPDERKDASRRAVFMRDEVATIEWLQDIWRAETDTEGYTKDRHYRRHNKSLQMLTNLILI